jgi:hypothetical protein
LAEAFAPRRAQTAAWVGLEPRGEVVIHLVEDHAGMREQGGAHVPEWAVAVCRRDDVLVFRLDLVDRSPSRSLLLVLAHEIMHQVLNHLEGDRLPRWFEEGLCVYNAGVPFLEIDTSLERAAAAGNLPPFHELDASFRADARTAGIAYKAGHSALIYFLRRFGATDLRALLKLVAEGRPFEESFAIATGKSLEEFEQAWRATVTPNVPYLLFVLLENIELTLLWAGALIVVAGYVRWRWRRERSLRSLEGAGPGETAGGRPSAFTRRRRGNGSSPSAGP